MPKRNLLQKLLHKFVPPIRKANEERSVSEQKGKSFDSIKDAVVGLRKLKKDMLPLDLKQKTPAEFNKIMRNFNKNSQVQRLKDIINSYKTSQRLK